MIDPVRVQIEADKFGEAKCRARLFEAFVSKMVGKPFKRDSQGVILIDLKVNNIIRLALYNPGCNGCNSRNNLSRIPRSSYIAYSLDAHR